MKQLSIPMTKAETTGTCIYLLIQLFLLPLILSLGNTLLPNPFSDTELNFIFFSVNFICVTAICHKYLLASLKKLFQEPLLCLRSAGLGLLIYFAGSYCVNYIVFLLRPDFINANDNVISSLAQDNYVLITIGTVGLVPLVEEVFYRGLIFRGLYGYNRVAAFILSATMFSAIHVTGYIGVYDQLSMFLSFLQYLPAGLSLAWSYVYADNIFAPILIHMAVNQIAASSMR